MIVDVFQRRLANIFHESATKLVPLALEQSTALTVLEGTDVGGRRPAVTGEILGRTSIRITAAHQGRALIGSEVKVPDADLLEPRVSIQRVEVKAHRLVRLERSSHTIPGGRHLLVPTQIVIRVI